MANEERFGEAERAAEPAVEVVGGRSGTRERFVSDAVHTAAQPDAGTRGDGALPEWMTASEQLLQNNQPVLSQSDRNTLLQTGNPFNNYRPTSRVLSVWTNTERPPGPGDKPSEKPAVKPTTDSTPAVKPRTPVMPGADRPNPAPPRMPYADETDVVPVPPRPVPGRDTTPRPGTVPGRETGPEVPPQPKPEVQPRPEGGMRRESNGDMTINYPGQNKSRLIKFDSDGRANQITTTDANGSTTMVRRGDQWHMRVQGMEFPMPGRIDVLPNGDISFELSERGFFRKEKVDGTTSQERTNEDGSRISLHADGSVDTVVRKDGSSISVSADGNTITERTAGGGRAVTWRKQADGSFASEADARQVRRNFRVDNKGTSSYDGPDGLKYLTGADGAMLVQGDGQAKITLDEQNRVKRIEYPDGKKARDIEYFDNSREIRKVVVHDLERRTSSTFERTEPGSRQWRTAGGSWNGDIRMGPGGSYSYKPEGSSVTANDRDGRWGTQWPDGSFTRDVISEDGSRLSYDSAGKLKRARAADGSSAEISENRISVQNPRTGDTVNWTKSGDTWRSDSQRFPDAVAELTVNEKCEVSFVGQDGNRVSILADGSRQIHRRDGSRLEVDDNQQVRRIIKGDNVRSFERGQDGQITRVTDSSREGGSTVVFERRPNDNVRSVDADADGNLRVSKNDGTAIIHKADRSRVELDAAGDPTNVTSARGHSREFRYTQAEDGAKQLTHIIETKRTSGGENRTETWTRRPGSNTFVATGANGREKVREDVQPVREGNDVGAYRYKGSDGKERLARAGSDAGDGSELSESVEEARERFVEAMRDKLKEPNAKRLDEMIKNFEDRMAERAQLRKRAGIKTAEEIDQWVERTVTETYDRLTEMVSAPDGDTFYDQKTRVKLAENFMYHAMDPTTSDQGPSSSDDPDGHGTCWIHSGHIWGMTQHPGAMADLLKQISLRGEFTTRNSGESDPTRRTFRFSSDYLSFRANSQEANWTIENAFDQWRDRPGYREQVDGHRSPVGKIFDYVIPVLGGERRPGDLDGGLYEDSPTAQNPRYRVGTRGLMYRVTGDAPIDAPYRGGQLIGNLQYPKGHLINGDLRLSLLEKGSVLNYTDGHLRSLHLRRMNGQWVLYQDDQHGELGTTDNKDTIVARITDLERWARGDRSAEQAVTQKPTRPRLVGSGAEDAIGAVRPRGGTSTTTPDSRPVAPPPRPVRRW